MIPAGWKDALIPGEAEADLEFAARLQAQSRAGLRTVGLAFPAVLLFVVGTMYLFGVGTVPRAAVFPAVLLLLVSACSVLLSRRNVPDPRAIGIGAVLLCGGCLMAISLIRTDVDPAADRYLPGQVGVVLLTALVLLPMLPLQALSLGAGLGALYIGATIIGPWQLNPPVVVAICMLTLLATVLAAVLYHRTWETHKASSEQLRSSRELSRAEIRRFVAQSAATTSRMAAALSHELNTPVGALKSSIDTLGALAARREGASEAQLARVFALEDQVLRSARDAANRLQQVVLRLQRVTNLDRAEVQLVDINALLQDVVYLLESEMRVRQREVKLEFGELAPVTCRPQQISAVLTNVFNLIADTDGRPGWTLRVQTKATGRDIEIVFYGTGPQFRSNETQAIFEPGFAERSGRVVASNWVLFMARQILRENGGEMRIDKSSATEHTLVLSLPAKLQNDTR